MNRRRLMRLCSFAPALLAAAMVLGPAKAQTLGPYEPDEHTVLLLHFEETTADSSFYGLIGGWSRQIGYVESLPGFGKALRLTNDSLSWAQPSYVAFPPLDHFDMRGPFMVEAWFAVDRRDSLWNREPCIVAKPRTPDVWYASNYWISTAEASDFLGAGFQTERGHVAFYVPWDSLALGEWYHVALVYDTTGVDRARFYLHDARGRLLYSFAAAVPGRPILTKYPLYVGYNGMPGSALNGRIDEVRLSNVARDFGTESGVREAGGKPGTATQFTLAQNYPNPFNTSTQIAYGLPEAGHVTAAVYSPLGRKVRQLVDENQSPGSHVVRWDGSDDSGVQLSSAVYICRVETNGLVRTRKMLLLR